jgi:predicted RNA binding protein YcfA (HicA-like mRNA interferase family)
MSVKLPRITCDDLVRVLRKAGFEEQRQKGSHLHMKHPTKMKRTTVPIHKGRIVPLGTLRSILRDADISVEEFKALL